MKNKKIKSYLDNNNIATFFTNLLKKHTTNGSITIFYHPKNEWFAKKILFLEKSYLSLLKSFYKINYNPQILFFLYPSKREMEKGFRRNLPNANCCFVPVKGKVSLITFTARNSLDSLSHILVHETSHVYFNFVTKSHEINNIQQDVPVWLDEGVALYLDSRFRKKPQELQKKRLLAFRDNLSNLLPLTKMYTYFNRLDSDQEFGPRGSVAYVFSYFCVLYLIRRFGEERFVKFLKALSSNKNINKVFINFFNCSIPNFNNSIKRSLLSSKEF